MPRTARARSAGEPRPGARLAARARRLALGLGLAALSSNLGCVQQLAVEPDVAVVTGNLELDPSLGEANIRVDITGSAPRTNNSRDLLLTDSGMTDEEGRFHVRSIRARGEGHFAVARHHLYDVQVGPLPPLVTGETVEWTEMFDTPTEEVFDPPDRITPQMFPKVPGRAKFVFVASESTFQSVAEVHVLGDFNGFSKTDGIIPLFDDGSQFSQEDPDGNLFISGDAENSDGVFVRFVDGLPPGNLRYNILVNRNVQIRDPFEEGHEDMIDEDGLRVVRSVIRVF